MDSGITLLGAFGGGCLWFAAGGTVHTVPWALSSFSPHLYIKRSIPSRCPPTQASPPAPPPPPYPQSPTHPIHTPQQPMYNTDLTHTPQPNNPTHYNNPRPTPYTPQSNNLCIKQTLPTSTPTTRAPRWSARPSPSNRGYARSSRSCTRCKVGSDEWAVGWIDKKNLQRDGSIWIAPARLWGWFTLLPFISPPPPFPNHIHHHHHHHHHQQQPPHHKHRPASSSPTPPCSTSTPPPPT